MPIYEYICQQCRHPFEKLVLGATEVVCPKCGSQTLDKQFSTFAVAAHKESSPCESGGDSFEGCGACGGAPGSCAWDDE